MASEYDIEELISGLDNEIASNKCSSEKEILEFLNPEDYKNMSPQDYTLLWCVANNKVIYFHLTLGFNNHLYQENIDKAKEAMRIGDRQIYYNWFCDLLFEFNFNNIQVNRLMNISEKFGNILYNKYTL